MGKIFKLITVVLLIGCLTFAVGCGKKNKDKDKDKNTSGIVSTDNSSVEGLPEEVVGESTGSGGGVVKEDSVDFNDLLNPQEYNKEHGNVSEDNTSSDKDESSGSSSSSSSGQTTPPAGNEKPSEGNIANENDTDTGYVDNGWY